MTSDGNNFDDFLENELTINFAILCTPILAKRYCIAVPSCPGIIWGNAVPQKIFGGTSLPRVFPRLHDWMRGS